MQMLRREPLVKPTVRFWPKPPGVRGGICFPHRLRFLVFLV